MSISTVFGDVAIHASSIRSRAENFTIIKFRRSLRRRVHVDAEAGSVHDAQSMLSAQESALTFSLYVTARSLWHEVCTVAFGEYQLFTS